METNDDELIKYENQLRRSISEVCYGILQGFMDSKSDLIVPHARHLEQFIEFVCRDKQRDESVSRSTIAVMGDPADALGQISKALFKGKTYYVELTTECLESDEDHLKDTAIWTREMISRALV